MWPVMDFRQIRGKLIDRDDLAKVVEQNRLKGGTVVFTNGCFDLLHPGHVHLLQSARSLGDMLIVAINTDESVRKIKDEGRPIFDEKERAYMLSALACVDHVVLFHESTPVPLLNLLKPDVLVKGGHYAHEDVVGWNVVEGYGGRVERVPVLDGISTTGTIERITGMG